VVDWAQDGATDPQLAGDVDGDGFVDLWTWSIQKSLWLSGSGTGVPLPNDVVHGRQLWNVQAVGDVDQDLNDDLLVSFWVSVTRRCTVARPPEEPPTPTGPPPEVDEQLVVVSTPEGTTCWCGVVPAAGGAWLSLASLAAVRARTRRRTGR
jgi:hypothetical protein